MLNRLIVVPKRLWLAAAAPRRTANAARYLSNKNALSVVSKHSDALLEAMAPQEVEFKHISFTFAIITLSAKIATADGTLERESYIAFRDAFPLSGGLCGKLRKLFVLACTDPTPIEHTVQQIKYLFPRNRELFFALGDRLCRVAATDRNVSNRKQRLLAKICHMLELTPSQYAELLERTLHQKPHTILGVEKRASKQRVKQRYYQLMRRYHPDAHGGSDLSPEVEQLLSLRTSEISSAYRALSKKAA